MTTKSTLNFMCEDSRAFAEDSQSFGGDLRGFLARERPAIEGALRERLPLSSLKGARRLNEALEYAVFPGGKRLRPALALVASDLAGAARAQGLAVACAVEFLHSSSLILDEAGARALTGKPARQDARHSRANAAASLGEDGARRLAEQLIARGVSRLRARFGERAGVRLLAEAAGGVLARAGVQNHSAARRNRSAGGQTGTAARQMPLAAGQK